MTLPGSLDEVIRGGLCIGCGLCVGLVEGASMELSPRGDLRPLLPAGADPALVDVCPGATVVGPDPAALEAGTRYDPVWGPRRAMHRGWAADPAVRHRAAAGGVLTALGRFLLDSGRVDAIVHVRASATHPTLTDAHVSRTAEDVLAGAQSRYGPAAPLVHVRELLDAGERFAVIAKPCDITAIRNLARHDPRVDERVPALLTIFCGRIARPSLPDAMARAHAIEPDAVTLFRFRGEGWPGPTRIEARDGRCVDLTYHEAYLDERETRWRYDAPWRCKVCVDQIGEVADLSVPDGWILDADGRPVHDEAPGVNVVVERTARGSELVAAAVAAGSLELAPISEADFEAMHADHRGVRLGLPARLAALREAGVHEPRVEGYDLPRLAQLAGPKIAASERAAMLGRIERGQAAG
jgi:coenzyme F420 hydrogenase subunit beta